MSASERSCMAVLPGSEKRDAAAHASYPPGIGGRYQRLAIVPPADQCHFFRSYWKVKVPSASVMSLIAASKLARVALSGGSFGSADKAYTVMWYFLMPG